MPIFSDDQISTWSFKYEQELAAKHDLIADRISIPIISGFNEYQVPNYVTNIRMILYLGKEIHAKGIRASIITDDTPGETSGSIPFEYVFSGKGLRVLKFYPTPMDNIATYVGDLWTPAADQAAVIVEFYRTAQANNPTTQLNLPSWMRQYMLKDYVCNKAFSAEGKQQDLRAVNHYQEKLDGHGNFIKKVKENMHRLEHNVLTEQKVLGRTKPGHPVLPPNFGFPVNW